MINNESKHLFLISSYPKSGNTLLRIILSSLFFSKDGKTNLEKVYAVGDIVRGASLVVWAIKDGRDTANAILSEIEATKVIAAE